MTLRGLHYRSMPLRDERLLHNRAAPSATPFVKAGVLVAAWSLGRRGVRGDAQQFSMRPRRGQGTVTTVVVLGTMIMGTRPLVLGMMMGSQPVLHHLRP